MRICVDPLERTDWPRVREIYAQGLATGQATFETDVPDWPAWDAAHLASCRLVARRGDDVVGWVALSPVSGRCIYAGVAEASVALHERAEFRVVGRRERLGRLDGIWKDVLLLERRSESVGIDESAENSG